MPKVTIDGQEVEVEPGTVLIQACEQLGIEIPRFCYHERLAIAGNCRMCLVEVSPGPPKPQASCALPCSDGMVVKTNTPMVKKAREGVMEFLLINHPLDCPICDQGGECDLQDQAMFYGSGKSRYQEHKRAVEDKYMGPLVKTEMTRCIHCTRCIRFATDVAGVPELGAFGRGEHMEVGTYVEKALTSELSGNLVDLCPVGALTSRPYAFLSRPWELTKTESIDVMDAVGSNIRVDSRGPVVLRVMPRNHDAVNEEWISDKTRFACDGLRVQRLDRPYVRNSHGKLEAVSWGKALEVVKEVVDSVQPNEIAALTGNLSSVEGAKALKDLMQAIGSPNMDCRQEGAKLPHAKRGDYLFNSTIEGVEEADLIFFIGTNPRWEASVLNARVREAWVANGTPIYLLGQQADLTYPYGWLGDDPRVLNEILAGSHELSGLFKKAKKPMLVLGMAAIARHDGAEVYSAARAISDKYGFVKGDWNGFNVLHHAAGRVGALDIGFVPGTNGRDIEGIITGAQQGEIKVVYLQGVDEIDMGLLGNAFVIYQGHHGDDGAHRADVILPSAAYTEQDSLYVNLEGRVQRTCRAVHPPGEAREEWAVVRAVSEALGKKLPYDTLTQLREKLVKDVPTFGELDTVEAAEISPPAYKASYRIEEYPFEPLITNFFMTDPVSRASRTMAECTRELLPAHQRMAA